MGHPRIGLRPAPFCGEPVNQSELKTEAPHIWGPERRGWHIEKNLNMGNLIAVIPVLVLMVASWATMGARIDQLERQRNEDIARMERQRAEDAEREKESRKEVLRQIEVVGAKLDRLIERLPSK